MRVPVTIPVDLLQEMFALAAARNDKAAILGGCNYKDEACNSLMAHVRGLVGEVAVAIFGEVKVDARIFHARGDRGADLHIAPFGSVQIKTTPYRHDPWLRVECDKVDPATQVYFLVWVPEKFSHTEPLTVEIVGLCARDLVLSKPRSRPLVRGGPENYIVKECELTQDPGPATVK